MFWHSIASKLKRIHLLQVPMFNMVHAWFVCVQLHNISSVIIARKKVAQVKIIQLLAMLELKLPRRNSRQVTQMNPKEMPKEK